MENIDRNESILRAFACKADSTVFVASEVFTYPFTQI